MKPAVQLFIVVYVTEDFVCPMSWDDDCAGALCVWVGGGDGVAVFEGRKAARKAIRVSQKFAQLCKAQGKPENTDFTTGVKNVKVVPLRK